MMTTQEMATAHLSSVKKTIEDMHKQKEAIDNEIGRLQAYLEEGLKVLTEAKE
jgi:archaellum component FlaC|tara:strand:- start:892 stop:1050 length:159 start_codon:yes stop_codon:yes gene_type:complete